MREGKKDKVKWYCGSCCIHNKWYDRHWKDKQVEKIRDGTWGKQARNCVTCEDSIVNGMTAVMTMLGIDITDIDEVLFKAKTIPWAWSPHPCSWTMQPSMTQGSAPSGSASSGCGAVAVIPADQAPMFSRIDEIRSEGKKELAAQDQKLEDLDKEVKQFNDSVHQKLLWLEEQVAGAGTVGDKVKQMTEEVQQCKGNHDENLKQVEQVREELQIFQKDHDRQVQELQGQIAELNEAVMTCQRSHKNRMDHIEEQSRADILKLQQDVEVLRKVVEGHEEEYVNLAPTTKGDNGEDPKKKSLSEKKGD